MGITILIICLAVFPPMAVGNNHKDGKKEVLSSF